MFKIFIYKASVNTYTLTMNVTVTGTDRTAVVVTFPAAGIDEWTLVHGSVGLYYVQLHT